MTAETMTAMPICTWTLNLLGSTEDYRSGEITRVSVTSADWSDESGLLMPSDDDVSAELSRQIGAEAVVCRPDAGDHTTLVETIYTVVLSAPILPLTAALAACVAALESSRTTATAAMEAWDIGPDVGDEADALAVAADHAAVLVDELEACELAARTALYHSPDEPCAYTLRDDSGSEEEIVAASDKDARKKAREWARRGDWDLSGGTIWIDVHVIDLLGESERVTVQIDPPAPTCEGEVDHDWQSPYSLLGGLEENPGVQGSGGGVVITEVCSHCGRYRVTDTWAQRPDTGEQGLHSVEYREADDDSLVWVASASSEDE